MKLFLAGLFIFGIPAYYLIRIRRKAKKKKKKHLQLCLAYDRLVKQVRFVVQHSELLKSKIIALDRRNKKLLIIDRNHREKQEECISLLGIENCRVIEIKYSSNSCIKKIFLELKSKWNNKITRFCFYDDSYDLITELPALAKSAKLWKHRIDLHKYPGSVGLQLDYVL
ncbi:MAG: hypothetical protein ACJ75B_08300 [Flavisolibacter sp.]